MTEIRERLRNALHASREEQVKTWSPARLQQERDWFVSAPVSLAPSAAGRSATQQGYRRPLTMFTGVVVLVLLIAGVSVANLKATQTAARAREMALRVSIGASRARLVQLVLTESALLAPAAAASGLAFAWWAAPFVMDQLNPQDRAVRLALTANWRVTAFALTLTLVTLALFGLAPAMRASTMKPANALKDGSRLYGRRWLLRILVAAQVAFCVLVLSVAGALVATFHALSNQPTGFSSARLLTLPSMSQAELPAEEWYQTTEHLGSLPSVESAALAQYALMSFNAQTRLGVGQRPDP